MTALSLPEKVARPKNGKVWKLQGIKTINVKSINATKKTRLKINYVTSDLVQGLMCCFLNRREKYWQIQVN